MARSGYAKGANKGKATEQRERPARPAAKKMVCQKRNRNRNSEMELKTEVNGFHQTALDKYCDVATIVQLHVVTSIDAIGA